MAVIVEQQGRRLAGGTRSDFIHLGLIGVDNLLALNDPKELLRGGQETDDISGAGQSI